ncbi:hypothetical protein [Pelagicoccus sp. SDUM812005]|uniref:hypothetical protein n=1 Tax=Pelagicoccus sp. SDUM812005 TaxID=3041257 RepID=UPI00280EBFE5|nr:hypothetical protein [Pelagicoccus sp. SDUM812005]MDQ8181663.1 hypothetical protein [Pelagicoccus sp. SDUM812005]
MKPKLPEQAHLPHLKLRYALYPVAKRLRDRERLQLRTRAFLLAFAICSGAAAIAYFLPSLAGIAAGVGLLSVLLSLVLSYRQENRVHLDYLRAARRIESENPDLKQALVTAVQQSLASDTGFFANKVASEALASQSAANWHRVAKSDAGRSIFAHLGALSILVFSLYACFHANTWRDGEADTLASRTNLPTTVAVEPGDTEIERGSSIVITARFGGTLPKEVDLELLYESGETVSHRMAKSLSDPVFAFSLQGVESPLSYRVNFAEQASDLHRVQVYDLPKLLNANAELEFPQYTGWEKRTVQDTLRLSAIEGTQLSYTFNVNKPVKDAYLRNKQGKLTTLHPVDEYRTQFLLESTLQSSEVYTLHLEDEAGRKNQFPSEIRIETILNKRPILKVEAPRGDLRVSPLEEVLFNANIADDFGLLDYGIAFAFPGEKPSTLSLAGSTDGAPVFEQKLNYLLKLEEYGVEPRDTFSWYLWASDYGPNGELRQTSGDLYFADVRSLEEIFREQDQGGSGQGQAGEQGLELLEKQRRIAISLFRIKNSATQAESERENLDVVQTSQIEAIEELQELIPQLREAKSVQIASEAQRFMEGVDVGLGQAIDLPSLDPLELAWSDAQGAYDRLVKLSDDEFNVSRSQNSQQGSGGGASRNQAQLNELDFRQEDSRYETASQAQALSNPDDKKDLELIAKLTELSRRQNDINQRLQEMQSDLALAETEEERQRIERELKRLEEEQRQMLADADEAMQQAGNRQSTRQLREQLEDVRENMRDASESLEEGRVSQALASGTRARNTLDQSREQMRESNSSEFSEALRETRSRASDLSQKQEELEKQLDGLSDTSQRKLDDSGEREGLARQIEEQSRQLNELLDQVREIAEASENVEPGLFRDLYQILRDNNKDRYEERYDESSLYLRQGFLDEARRGQRGLSRDLSTLSESISEAAESVLGTAEATLQFAQAEIDALNQQLESERQSETSSSQASGNPGSEAGEGSPSQGSPSDGSPSEGSAGGGGGLREQLRNALSDFQQTGGGPLTGASFSEWIDSLNTVESLLEEPNVRGRVSEARETAESMRRDFKRHGELPQWEMIEEQIAQPLGEVRAWLAEELRRTQGTDTLQPIDRDPVPDEYNKIVRSYYESLGND